MKPIVVTSLSRKTAKTLDAGDVVELGSGILEEDAKPVIEVRRITVLRFGRAVVQGGDYLPAAFEAPPSGDHLIPCPACSEQILASARKCKHCGEWLTSPAAEESRKPSNMANWGTFLALVGGVAVLFALIMDTTVAVQSGGRVHNIGLINQQQSFLLVGGLAVVGGIILIVAGRKK